MYWYILFVRTGREQQVETLLKNGMDDKISTPFIPMYEKIFKSAGIVKREIIPLFPGYVFVESVILEEEFWEKIRILLKASDDILSLLRYSESEFALRESEKQMLLNLCNENYYIESSSGVIDGDKIILTDGPLRGWESFIKKVDRHKRQAWISIEFMGDARLLCVPLEIIRKY